MGYCRTLEFLNSVTKAKKPLDVINKEVVYLRSCYPVLSSLKRAFTIYRNSTKALDTELKNECFKKFTLTFEELQLLKQQNNEQIANEHRNLRPIKNIDDLILKAEMLLKSNSSYYDLIIGLCLLTGRRAAEIACTAEFEIIDDYHLMFKGQLKTKTRGELNPFIIPTLTKTDLIMTSLNKLRLVQSDLINNPALFHNRASKNLSLRVKKHFEPFFKDPKIKDLRSLYGEISYYLLDDNSITKMRYMSDILGHGETDNLTGQSYLDFYIDA